jgi:hypothetical protein
VDSHGKGTRVIEGRRNCAGRKNTGACLEEIVEVLVHWSIGSLVHWSVGAIMHSHSYGITVARTVTGKGRRLLRAEEIFVGHKNTGVCLEEIAEVLVH